MRVHMWVQAVDPSIRPENGYGICGVYIGQFTSKVHEVSCTDCQVILDKSKESDGPQAAG